MHGGRAFLAGVAIGAVTMSAVGLVATGVIQTPLQVAARTAPPAPSVLTATARRQVLRNTIVFGGRITAGRAVYVMASAPYSTVVITKLPVRAGQRVRPGQLLAEVDGRPIFLLRGMLPAYRDMHEGDTGPDVAQLQRALEQVGYADFDQAGYFGESTELALALFYHDRGYAAPADRTEPGRPGGGRSGAASTASAAVSAVRQVPAAVAGQPPGEPGQHRSAAEPPVPEAYLPMSEVSYIPAPSALVVAVNARVGTAATTSPILRLATGEPIVTGQLGQYQARGVHAGMAARITSAIPALSASGVVTYIGTFPVRNGQVGQPGGYRVIVTGVRSLSQHLIGTRVRLTLLLAATGTAVLAVPLAAIMPAGRSAQVIRLTRRGQRVDVRVVTGISAGGLVAVRPVLAGALAPGDQVVIGPAP